MSRRPAPLSVSSPPLSPLPAKPAALSLPWRATAFCLLLANVALAAGHLATTPVATDSSVNYVNAPDEAAHLLYVRTLAEAGRLPVRGDSEYPTYEWHQPPLYYQIASLLYPVGARAIRWLSLLFGLASLIVLFLGIRMLIPDDPPAAVLGLGFAALLPMRQAISSAAGNDSLTELTFTATTVVLIASLRTGFPVRRAALTGLILAAALLSKASALILLPVFAVALWMMARCGESRRSVVRGATVALIIVVAGTGGWFARNIRLYGEITPARAFLQEFEGTKKASDIIAGGTSRLDYMGEVAEMTFQSFWAAYTPHSAAAHEGRVADIDTLKRLGFFARNGIPVFMPAGFYTAFGLAGAVALLGLIRLHFRRRALLSPEQRMGLALCFLVIALVAAAFAGFVWTFFQTQGRYLYPALFPISAAFSLGFRGALPSRYRNPATAGVLLLFLVLALAFLEAGVVPAYA